MVVCKCRKATNLYCFVHKVPVCGECICFSEHHICVVRTYSDWVLDGDYDWPPKCSICDEILQNDVSAISRLGCLHVLHSSCLSKHLQSFPPHTAPAGYTCPDCSAPIWPPKIAKDYNSALSLKLKEIILQNGLSKTLLGNDGSASQPLAPPPAFTSAPLATLSASNQTGMQTLDLAKSNANQAPANEPQSDALRAHDGVSTSNSGTMKEGVDSTNRAHLSLNMAALSKIASPTTIVHPGAMTRKPSARVDKVGQNYGEYDGEDEDEASKKYNRRGLLQKQAIKYLIPFSPNASPTLPITTTSRKDDQTSYAEEIIEGRQRRRSRSSGVNTKKILLLVAIMSCMVTMLLLYYRLLQGTPPEDIPELNSNQDQR